MLEVRRFFAFSAVLLAIAASLSGALAHPPDPRIPTPVNVGGSTRAVPTVRFRWPMLQHEWWHHAQYVDLDPTAGVLDYGCEGITYDGHFGNDTMIEDFYSQDEGRSVVAAAPGVVTYVEDGNYDRETVWDPGSVANAIIMQHADDTYSYYLHFRKWSTRVHEGQLVREGQPLGEIGSSGFTDWPHVHFEVQNGGTAYEPFTGNCRPGDTLWQDQQPHVLTSPMSLRDYGLTTTQPVRQVMLERPPMITHLQQGPGITMYLWVKVLDTRIGDESRVVFRTPDDVAWLNTTFVHPDPYGVSWWYWSAALPESGSTGTWTVEYLINGASQFVTPFEYDASAPTPPTVVAPNIAVDRGVFRGAIPVTPGENGIKEISVTLEPANGEVVLYGPRKGYFEYVPDSGYSGFDLMRVEVEDGNGVVGGSNMIFNISPTVGNALRLTGEEDYLAVAGNGSLDVAGGLTIEAWLRRSHGSAGWRLIVDRRPEGGPNDFGYHLAVDPAGRLRMRAGTGVGWVNASGSTRLPLDRWVHVAGTWDGSWLRLYVDGQEDGSTFFNGSISYTGVSTTRIGGSVFDGESFRGELAEVRIWDVARTPAELAAGMTCSFLDNPPPASLKARWPLQGDGNDTTANGNNGTLVAPAPTPGFHPNPVFVRTDSGLRFDCPGTDSDADTLMDNVDNCSHVQNLAQDDTDTDGWGDACDLCPSLFDVRQVDSDRDGVGDRCDVCPFKGDTGQTDGDADGSGDLCDPSPSNSTQGVPLDGITLGFAAGPGPGETTMSWTAEALSATYEVIRGSAEEIRDRFYGTCQNSRDPDTTDTSFVEDEVPAPGEYFGFLVIGVAADGTRGRAGFDTEGRARDLRVKDCL
jgi:hypothetical protein